MKNVTPDGRTLRELVETALSGNNAGPAVPDGAPAASSTAVGELLDTHHPHLPGRVLVRWLGPSGEPVERWIQRERHLALHPGDRVLLTLPAGWPEWIVTGALGREPREPLPVDAPAPTLHLGPGEALRVVSQAGEPLLTLRQGPDGPILELATGALELHAARTLRLSADTIELAAGSGGVDIRTDGDAVVRARTIRLN